MKRTLLSFCLTCIASVAAYAQSCNADKEYGSLVKDISSAEFSLLKCIEFLDRYPTGELSDKVSDLISLYYTSILSPASNDSSFAHALSYAKTDSAARIVKAEIKEKKSAKEDYARQYVWQGRLQAGIGIQYETWRNTGIGGTAEFRIGRIDDRLNFSAGAGVKCHNAKWSRNNRFSYINCWQYPVFSCIRVNLFKIKSSIIYSGFGAAYNIQDKTENFVNTGGSEIILHPNVMKNFFSCSGQAGIRTGFFEISIYCTYDLTPQYNKNAIAGHPETIPLSAFGPTVDERFRIGLSLMLYINL